jgi:hypothetical protein
LKTDLLIFPIYTNNSLDNAELLISEIIRIQKINILIYFGNENMRLKTNKAKIFKNNQYIKILSRKKLGTYLESLNNVNITIFTDEYGNRPIREILQLKLNFKSQLHYYQHGLNHELKTY